MTAHSARTSPASLAFALVVTLAAGLAGCGGGDAADAAVLDDAPYPDAWSLGYDAGPPCSSAEDCDDGLACTLDRCNDGLCLHQSEPGRCDDGVFCNGREVCDLRRGCIAGPRESCDDGDVCTVDRCNEATKSCDRTVRDLDGDGDPDFFCTGGTDCDDFDPTRNGTVAEVCTDGTDNDCDGLVDETVCGRPTHDVCEDALVITAAGTYVLETAGAAPDYTIGCASTVRQDLVASLVVPAGPPQDVSIELEGDFFVTALSLRTTCDELASELACRSGYPSVLRRRALEPGTYTLVLSSLGGPGSVALTVDLSEATEPPTNEACADAIEVPVPTGGTFTGSFVGVGDDVSLPCGTTGQPDLFYSFTIPEGVEHTVSVSLTSATGESMSFAVLDACGGNSLRCAYGSPARARTYRLGAGTYVVAVEGPSWVEVDYRLQVSFEAPSDPVPGDVCATAIPVTPGTPYTGTLVGAEDDVSIECSYRAPDLLHRFTLEDDADVTVTVNGGRAYLSTAIAPECPLPDGIQSLFCGSGTTARARVRNLPAGAYYVYVEGSRAGAYTLDVTATTPPTPFIDVSGNDNCATAHVVPPGGGLFRGSTALLLHNYTPVSCALTSAARDAVFQLDLTARQRVVASTAGSTIDTVLYMLGASCTSELACDDDGAGSGDSLLDRTLEPGTYYFVVDAFSSTAAGEYFFEIQLEPAP